MTLPNLLHRFQINPNKGGGGPPRGHTPRTRGRTSSRAAPRGRADAPLRHAPRPADAGRRPAEGRVAPRRDARRNLARFARAGGPFLGPSYTGSRAKREVGGWRNWILRARARATGSNRDFFGIFFFVI